MSKASLKLNKIMLILKLRLKHVRSQIKMMNMITPELKSNFLDVLMY